jgi:hypothetical protein
MRMAPHWTVRFQPANSGQGYKPQKSPALQKTFLHGLFCELCTDRFMVQRTWLFFIADRKRIAVEPRYDHGNIVFTTTLVGFINQFSASFGDTI